MDKKYYLLIIVLCFLPLLFRYDARSKPRQSSDFHVTYETAKRFAAKEDIYTKFNDPSVANFKYSPFFAFLFAPFSLLSLREASLIFFAINFVFLLLMFVLSKAIIIDDPLPKKDQLLLYILTLICVFRFVLAVLDAGQINILMITFVVIALYLMKNKKEELAGAFLALSIMFKYTPFVFIPYFVVRKKWKVVIYTFIFMILYCLIPAVYVGLLKEAHYLREWLPFLIKTSLDQGSLCDLKNQSFYSFILRYFTTGQYFCDNIIFCDNMAWTNLTYHQGLILSVALSILIYSLVLLPVPNSHSTDQYLIDYALLFICMPLFNANAWLFNYMSPTFSYMLVFYYLLKNDYKDVVTLVLVVLSFILGSGGTRGIVGAAWQELSQLLSSTTIGAMLLMAALFRLKFSRAFSKKRSL